MSILPKDTSGWRSRESNHQPSNKKGDSLCLLSHSTPKFTCNSLFIDGNFSQHKYIKKSSLNVLDMKPHTEWNTLLCKYLLVSDLWWVNHAKTTLLLNVLKPCLAFLGIHHNWYVCNKLIPTNIHFTRWFSCQAPPGKRLLLTVRVRRNVKFKVCLWC